MSCGNEQTALFWLRGGHGRLGYSHLHHLLKTSHTAERSCGGGSMNTFFNTVEAMQVHSEPDTCTRTGPESKAQTACPHWGPNRLPRNPQRSGSRAKSPLHPVNPQCLKQGRPYRITLSLQDTSPLPLSVGFRFGLVKVPLVILRAKAPRSSPYVTL